MTDNELTRELIDDALAQVEAAIDRATRGEPFPSGHDYPTVMRGLREDLDDIEASLGANARFLSTSDLEARLATQASLVDRLTHLETRN